MGFTYLNLLCAYLLGLGTWGLASFVIAMVRACRHCKTPWWPWEAESFHAPDCPSLELTTGPAGKSPLIDEQLTDLTVDALRTHALDHPTETPPPKPEFPPVRIMKEGSDISRSPEVGERPCPENGEPVPPGWDSWEQLNGAVDQAMAKESPEPCPDFVKANTEPEEGQGDSLNRLAATLAEEQAVDTISKQAKEIEQLKAALKEHNAKILSKLEPEFQRAAAAMMQTAIDQVEASLYSKEGMDPPKRFAPLPKLVIDDDGRHPLAAVAARIASEATETADKPRPNPCLDPDKMLGAADQFSGHEYPGEYEIDPVASIEVFDRFVFEGKIETRITESPEALEKCNTCHEPADFEVHMVVLERGETTTRRRTACREHLADHVSTEVPSDVYPLEKTSGPPEDLPF